MPPDEPPRRRRERRDGGNHGRRESDRLYDSLCHQLGQLRDSLKEAVKDLRGLIREVDEDLKEDIEELEGTIEKVDNRLTEVEVARIEDTARTNERAALKIQANERRSKWSLRVGIAAGVVGIAAFLVDHLHG